MQQKLISSDRDLRQLRNHLDGRWTQACTTAKCVALYIATILACVATVLALIFAGGVALDYYYVIRTDPTALKQFCESLFTHGISYLFGLLPPVVYIYSERQQKP